MTRSRRRDWSGVKVRILGGVTAAVVAVDAATKLVVERTLRPYEHVEVLGDVFRLTYIHNPGAAFGIHVGDHSRYLFMALSVAALAALLLMYRATPPGDRVRLTAIALITGGALGNLADRIRSARGVIDFLDVGIGTVRWPVFNIADVAVTTGAVLLALSLWHEEHNDEAPEAAEEAGEGG